MPPDDPILIAGAGIAGLTAALALDARGFPVRLLERRGSLSEAGAGIQIGPNGMRVLAALGVAPALEQRAGRPQAIVIRDGTSGRELTRLPLGDWINKRHGAPYCVAHRADLQAVLLDQLQRRGLTIDLNFEVTSAIQDATTVDVTSRQGQKAHGRALIAADGVFSLLRSQICPAAPPHPSGKHAMRTILSLADVTGSFAQPCTGVWLRPDAHVVHYPIRAGAELAIVVITDEPATHLGWSRHVELSDVLARLRGFAPELLELLSRTQDWRAWSLFDAPALPVWSSGRITLAGDAAHPTLPFLAQGGAMALEDAMTLAEAMALHPRDPSVAFRAYERVRRIRTDRVQDASRTNGRIYHLAGLAAIARNAALAALPGSRLMAGLDWLYGWTRDPLPSR